MGLRQKRAKLECHIKTEIRENSSIVTDTQIGKIICLKRNGEFVAAAVIVTLMIDY